MAKEVRRLQTELEDSVPLEEMDLLRAELATLRGKVRKVQGKERETELRGRKSSREDHPMMEVCRT